MALRINTNVAALNAHKNMIKTDNSLSASLERLSSGLRINKAADDASGMSIADSLRSQSMGLGQAIKNANDGINIVQTADAALDESINIINTIKTKSIQAAQDGQTTESRAAIQSDITKLMEELDIIAKTTAFNGQKLLSGNFVDKKFQIGAYSGETVNISIASAESTKIGHVTAGKLSLANDAPGSVEIAIYSSLQNKNFEIQATEVGYTNSRENSMAAVADSINKLSDVLGITAAAVVQSSTDSTIGAGTLEEFSINGVAMNGINVTANDADGSLVKAINAKTSQHGVLATVNTSGQLTLKSSDGRAIEVKGDDAGLASVFKGQNLSTVGHINLTQAGSNDIVITNVDGGDAVTLTNNMDVLKSETFTSSATATVGSKIAKNSILGAGWTTNQDIVADSAFTSGGGIITSSATTLAVGSVISSGSNIVFNGTINGDVTSDTTSTSTTAPSTLAAYSTIISGSILAPGSKIGTGVELEGTSIIEATAATTSDNTITSGSILAAGSVLAKNTVLSGLTATIGQTSATVGDSIVSSGSTLAAGTVISATTVLDSGNTFIIEATEATTSVSTIGSGSILTIGSVLGNGTIISGQDIVVFQTDAMTATSTINSGSTIKAGSVLLAGTVLGSGVVISGLDGTLYGSGNQNITLDVDVTVLSDETGSRWVTAAAGSSLGNGTTLASGSLIYADLTLASGLTLVDSGVFTIGSSLAGGTTLITQRNSIGTDLTLRSASTLVRGMTVKTGAVLADGTALTSKSNIGADITLKSSATLGGADVVAKAGSSFAAGSSINKDSTINAEVTLKQASTLTNGMDNITREVTLGTGSVLASTSVLREGSTFYGAFRIDGDVSFSKKQEIGIGSTIETANTFIKAGSTVGGATTAKAALNIVNGPFTLGAGTKLVGGSMLANGSTIGGTITLDKDEKVAAGTQMQLEAGSTLAEGSKITAGTYLTNDITAADGTVYKAGTVLESDITTSGVNKLTNAMTLKEGSIMASGSTIAANAGGNAATAQVTDSSTVRLSEISVLTQEGAQIAISVADATLKDLDKVRADLGSVQNQLTSTIANISTTQVNVKSAESSIRDVDFAEEAANFTKMQILAQAGSFAMSQANASAQTVLSLLQ
ncbi:MAG: flagellin [Desulfobacteraceae bacterium]|nr:flagellin [Desulfobacteraceae bacterium]